MQLVHNASEDLKTSGDVAIRSADGVLLAECAAFQHNRNLGMQVENAAALTKRTVEALEAEPAALSSTIGCCAPQQAASTTGADCCGSTKAETKVETKAEAKAAYHLLGGVITLGRYGGVICAAVLVTLTLRAVLARV